MASDYSNPAARSEMAAASFAHAAPARAPEGLARLSTIWTAPFARYAPPYVRNASFGYMLSAMFGAGLIVLICMKTAARAVSGYHRGGFFERNIKALYLAMDRALYAENSAAVARPAANPRSPREGRRPLRAHRRIGARIATLDSSRRFWRWPQCWRRSSLISLLRTLATRVWAGAFAFTGAIAIPALFLTPGRPLWRFPNIGWAITDARACAPPLSWSCAWRHRPRSRCC